MKQSTDIITFAVCFFGIFTFINNNVFSQGNSGGNANPSNNANANAIKWETQGNLVDSTDFIGTTNSSALKFKSNNVERLRITVDGKVGIGTTEPTRELEVLGNTLLRGDLFLPELDTIPNYQDEKILFLNSNNKVIKGNTKTLRTLFYEENDEVATFCDMGYIQPSPTWSNDPNIIYSTCPEVYVGIGTNDPQKLLDVRGTTQTRKLEVGREYSNYSLISGYRTGVSSVSLLSLGHYNPQTQTEHLNLGLTSSGELSLNYKELQQGSTGEILSVNSESFNVLKLNDEGSLYLNYLGQGQALTIRSESDNRKLLELENNGLLRSRKIRIDLENWSDFVFEKDYPLMPLADLKIYIAENKHLPDIPSEEVLVEEGLDLAEMNKLLMQKVEELTLYLLDQNDKTEALQKEVEDLKIELSRLK